MRGFAGLALLALVVFVLAGAALLPMRVVMEAARLDQFGLAAGNVSGSVWAAKLSQARFRGADLGTLRLGLSPLSLLAGSPSVAFATLGASDASGAGSFRLPPQPGLENVSAAIPLSGMGTPLPLRGQLRLVGVSFRFANGKCVGAAGRITTDALSASAASLGWQGPDLEGPVTCVDNAALATLAGERDGVRVLVRLWINNGAFLKLDSEIAGVDALGEAALSASGFVQGPNGWTRTDQGR